MRGPTEVLHVKPISRPTSTSAVYRNVGFELNQMWYVMYTLQHAHYKTWPPFECWYSACRTPRAINMPNAQSVGNPHPDATGLNGASGIDVLLTLQYTRTGLAGPTYMVSNA